MNRLQRFLIGCVIYCLLSLVGRVEAASGSHLVFAHYMVCYACYGETVEGYTQEIQAAQAAGIDGFALNVGAWSGLDTYYKARVALIYQAAEKMDTGFKLFFSIDLTNRVDIEDMLRTYGSRTNSLRYQSKTVVSTYGAMNASWKSIFAQLKTEGMDYCFIPYFWGNSSTWNLSILDGQKWVMTNYGADLDGYFYFAARLPKDIVNYNIASMQVCREAGKLFMAGYSPHYWGFCQPWSGRPYYESQGGEGTQMQWTNIIELQPDWVEMTTWNDVNESTYLLPMREADLAKNLKSALTPPPRYFHGAYLELAKYYIAWFKTGAAPKIEQDALFTFYCTQPTNAAASTSNEVPVTFFYGKMTNVVYSTLMLTSPGNLEVSSGGMMTTNILPAGISHVQTPCFPGAQAFTLRRDGQAVLSLQGHEVEGREVKIYNYFPVADFIYGPKISPPSGLHYIK